MLDARNIQTFPRCKTQYGGKGVHTCHKPKSATVTPKETQTKPQAAKRTIPVVPEGKEIEFIHKPFIASLKARGTD